KLSGDAGALPVITDIPPTPTPLPATVTPLATPTAPATDTPVPSAYQCLVNTQKSKGPYGPIVIFIGQNWPPGLSVDFTATTVVGTASTTIEQKNFAGTGDANSKTPYGFVQQWADPTANGGTAIFTFTTSQCTTTVHWP